MNSHNLDLPEVLIVSSYPQRECGIATYSKDLWHSLTERTKNQLSVQICALQNGDKKHPYPSEVKYILDTSKKEDYRNLAEQINNDHAIQLVFIQHEFGLFGGLYGNYLHLLLKYLRKPTQLTFHTVLPNPDFMRLMCVKKIAKRSQQLVVMTNDAKRILSKHYNIEEQKISVVPHGTHTAIQHDKQILKQQYGYSDKKILSTFGLISSNKNIENVLLSLPTITKKFPDVLYLVIGITHPEVQKNEGEKYRNYLETIVNKLNLAKHVKFVNQYLETEEILRYLQMSDLYLFNSKDRHQAVSGTFSYALSCGCPIVATSIPHAKEYLTEDTGILVDFEEPEQLSQAVNHLLENEDKRKQMGMNALHKSSKSTWKNAALNHIKIFEKSMDLGSNNYSLPEISLQHLVRITHHFGVLQFCKLNKPDIQSGYTLDDNARALIVCCYFFAQRKDNQLFLLIDKYLRFIGLCQQENGLFINYLDEIGGVSAQNANENLEDSNGRAIWSLCTILSMKTILPAAIINRAEIYLRFAISELQNFTSPRAKAFCLKGFYLLQPHDKHSTIDMLSEKFGNDLLQCYGNHKLEDWHWFENELTYSNSILPEGLLCAYLLTGNQRFKIGAKETFDFLIRHIVIDDRISVIPNKTWFKRGSERVYPGGEQPIEVAYFILSLNLFDQVFPGQLYYELKQLAFSWFMGNNVLNEMVYDPTSGGCHDGIEVTNVNLNQGAESTICYLLARLNMEDQHTIDSDNHFNKRANQFYWFKENENKIFIQQQV